MQIPPTPRGPQPPPHGGSFQVYGFVRSQTIDKGYTRKGRGDNGWKEGGEDDGGARGTGEGEVYGRCVASSRRGKFWPRWGWKAPGRLTSPARRQGRTLWRQVECQNGIRSVSYSLNSRHQLGTDLTLTRIQDGRSYRSGRWGRDSRDIHT
jgi:hypothetical protein